MITSNEANVSGEVALENRNEALRNRITEQESEAKRLDVLVKSHTFTVAKLYQQMSKLEARISRIERNQGCVALPFPPTEKR